MTDRSRSWVHPLTAGLAILCLSIAACGEASTTADAESIPTDRGMSICEAGELPIGTEVRIYASYKQEAVFGMAGAFCGDSEDPDSNPLLIVEGPGTGEFPNLVNPGEWVTVVGVIQSKLAERTQPWLTLRDGRLEQ